MNFQQKLFETGAELRARAFQIADSAVKTARAQAEAAAARAGKLKEPVAVIGDAGRALGKVARRHATRFLKQNATLASKVRDDVGAIARNAMNSLQKGPTRPRKPAARKRKASARAA